MNGAMNPAGFSNESAISQQVAQWLPRLQC